ncbi:MAG: hypothetical protein IJX65_04395 [Alistipes sp.]|nr:hypothetical protein [Alistipes sp.]
MAYFIVIGANNDIQDVVGEIKNAHLQHNVITSGCIVKEVDGLHYRWDIYDNAGDKINESDEPIALHKALTNQISHFKNLIPSGVVPNVFIVSQCLEEEHGETLRMVCEELREIGGAMMLGLHIDIVLIGYDINKPEDVTIRPHWKLLESLRGLEVDNRFRTDILYINNMDYMGAATSLNSNLLAKFLCYWSKLVCSGDDNPKTTVGSGIYSIGMSEHQYDFCDLNDFFRLSAEERLLNRALNAAPSLDTQKLIDYNYYKKIDLGLQWLDGLRSIWERWNLYCTAQWNPAKLLVDNEYSVSRQEQQIATYLNSFLKLYISEEKREISNLNIQIKQKEAEIAALESSLLTLDPTQILAAQVEISQLKDSIADYQAQIEDHEENICKNTFIDADEFCENYGHCVRVTEEDEENYSSHYQQIDSLVEYLKSDEGIKTMRYAVDRATVADELPQNYPVNTMLNVGRAEELPVEAEMIQQKSLDDLPERTGCLTCFFSFFNKRKKDASPNTLFGALLLDSPALISEQIREDIATKLNKCIAELKRVDEVRDWWSHLTEMIENYEARRRECILLMDGEKNVSGQYVLGKEGYRPKWHIKSISLIDMELVRKFRDSHRYYAEMIDRFLCRWFDATAEPDNRMTMLELIKHQVLDPLVGKYHTLKWDGSNPFVKEMLTDQDLHRIIEYNITQSKPFVEYIRIRENNLASNVSIGFFSNNQNVIIEPTEFRARYEVGTESIVPQCPCDFVNSLCVVQVLNIPDHIDAIKDFKPKREAKLSRLRTDLTGLLSEIIDSTADTVEKKARCIYNWLCENIEYDTTKQIQDADTCLRSRRGVCWAYCEMFCYLADAIGLTADIITGKVKISDGTVSDSKHSWIFVYTNAYAGLLIDPTWGAGCVDNGKFIKHDDNSVWFNVSPSWMIYSHFPDLQYWTKLDIRITEEQFRRLPYKQPSEDNDGKDALFEELSDI